MATAHLVHKTISEALTNHNRVLANSIGNVLKQVIYGASVDQIRLAYSNDFNPLAVGSNVTNSSQQPNDGQYQQPPVQQPP